MNIFEIVIPLFCLGILYYYAFIWQPKRPIDLIEWELKERPKLTGVKE